MDQNDEQVEFEVIAPVRLYRRSRAVGDRVFALEDDVRDQIGSTLVRVVAESSGPDSSQQPAPDQVGAANHDPALEPQNAANAGQAGKDAEPVQVAEVTLTPNLPAARPAAKRGSKAAPRKAAKKAAR